MGEVHPVERYPAWALQTVLLTALAMLAAAAVIAILPHAISGHAVLAAHCFVNGVVLYATWNTHRVEGEGTGLLQLALRLVAFGFGFIDLFLAGHAVFDLSPANAPLLGLALPGVAGWLTLDLQKRHKESPEENEIADAAALTPETNEEVFTAGETLRASVGPLVFYTVYGCAVMFGIGLCAMWYCILRDAVDRNIAFDFLTIADLAQKTLASDASYVLGMIGLIAVITIAGVVGPLLLRPFKRWIKRRRNKPAAAVDQRVETRLRAVWDYANRPNRSGMTVPIVVLPLCIFAVAAAAVIAFGFWNYDIALRLMTVHHPPVAGWIVFDNSTTGLLYVMVAAAMAAWSLWHFIVDRWPGAAEAVMTLKYQRKTDNVGVAVKGLRASLRGLVKKTGDAPFDPRRYLLDSRRRSGRWLYGITAVCVIVGVWGAWASLNSYTLLTADGIEDVSGYSGSREIHAWGDVRQVDVRCTLNSKGESSFDWEARFDDGRTLSLFRSGDLERSLPELVMVDAILRRQGVNFQTRNPATGESRVTAECIEKIGADLPDRRGFLHLMHRD